MHNSDIYFSEKRVNETKNKLYKTMVPNPIYDESGPAYEMVAVKPVSPTSVANPHVAALNTTNPFPTNQQYDTIYIAKLSSRQNSSSVDIDHHAHSSINTSSMAATSLNDLKSGQKRNKLHLTLSLDGIYNNSKLIHDCCRSVTVDANGEYTALTSDRNAGCNRLSVTRKAENCVFYTDV